jgi:hypothetical protein
LSSQSDSGPDSLSRPLRARPALKYGRPTVTRMAADVRTSFSNRSFQVFERIVSAGGQA